MQRQTMLNIDDVDVGSFCFFFLFFDYMIPEMDGKILRERHIFGPLLQLF